MLDGEEVLHGMTAELGSFREACAGTPVGVHARCWDSRRTIIDPAHVATAHRLRTEFRTQRATGHLGPQASGEQVGQRPLSVYDDLFDLTSSGPRAGAGPGAVA